MNIKRTAKYKAALRMARALAIPALHTAATKSNDALYHALAVHGLFWDSQKQRFTENRTKVSIFADEAGKDTGAWRLRLTAHPDSTAVMVDLLVDFLRSKGHRVSYVSNNEKNKNGAGVRVYVRGNKRKRKAGRA